MKQLVLLIVFVLSVSAMDTTQVMEFVTSSITPMNAQYIGIGSNESLDGLQFGPALSLSDINSDSLQTYPSTRFYEESPEKLVPVILNGSVRFFVVIDENGQAVSMGYRKLAEEMVRVASTNNIPLETISLFSSTQINSYLFSVPSRSRGASNLTILEPNWDRARSGLKDESETISQLIQLIEGR